jgi:translation initiation factor 1A
MSKKKEELARQAAIEQQITRIRLPRENQTIAIIEQRLGGSRMKARCLDGRSRICRIPGRLKRNLWVREGDVVIVEFWEFGGEDKGDIVFKYSKSQIQFLKKKGYLDKMGEFEAF